MQKQNNKLIFYYTVTLIILLVIVSVLLYAFYTKQQNMSKNRTSISYQKFSNEEQKAEKELFQSMEEKAKALLVKKNKWNSNDFTISERYIDGKHYVGLIISSKPNIKNGTVLIATNKDQWELLFDPTTQNPCVILTGDREYLKEVIDECHTQQ